jgi:hypothetical protein
LGFKVFNKFKKEENDRLRLNLISKDDWKTLHGIMKQ